MGLVMQTFNQDLTSLCAQCIPLQHLSFAECDAALLMTFEHHKVGFINLILQKRELKLRGMCFS